MSRLLPKIRTRGNQPSQYALLTIAFVAGLSDMEAAVWQSDRWALGAAVEAGVGYDDNLFARAGSEGDGYLLLAPSATMQRLNSLTSLEVAATARTYSYFELGELNSIDPKAEVTVRYPADTDLLATEEFHASAERRTEANIDVGGRLRLDDYQAKWEGSFNPGAKLNLRARVSANYTNYLTSSYSDTDALDAGVTLGLVSNERLQMGAGYDYEASRSMPDSSLREDTRGRRHIFTFRARGEFLPKVTGYAFVGVSYNDYSGETNYTDWEPVASVSLVWQVDARRTLTGRANRLFYFAPDGSTTAQSELAVELTQEFAGGFSVAFGGSVSSSDYRYTTREQTVERVAVSGELRYELTERFTAKLRAEWSTQDSNDPLGSYDHGTAYASVQYNF